MHGRLIFLVFLTAGRLAHAADQTILGTDLVVSNPGTPDQRKVSVRAKEVGTDGIVGSAFANGASVTVTAVGDTTNAETYDLPAGTSAAGKPFWTRTAGQGFKYRDARGENGPVTSALIQRNHDVFTIKLAVSAKRSAVALVPPNAGTAACVLVTADGGDSFSVRFAAGDAVATSRGTTLFRIRKPGTEGSCVTTTTTITSTTTSTSTTLPIPCGETSFPTCGGMCPDGSVCEGRSSLINSELDDFCAGGASADCACVPAGEICGGGCSSFSPLTYDVTWGDCGAGRHCALHVDNHCFVFPPELCVVGCVDD